MVKLERGKMLRLLRKLAEFSASSLLGTVVDTAVLWVCSTWLFDSYFGKYIVSPAISFECAVWTNFSVAYYYIWRDRVSRRTTRSFFRHLGGYNLSCIGVFLVKMGFLLLIERIFSWNVVWCNLLALCFSGGINFILNERVIFRKRKALPASSEGHESGEGESVSRP